MPRGGCRPGAGRKPGSLTRRTREIAEQAAGDGITPLEYMLAVMRDPKEPPERRGEMPAPADSCALQSRYGDRQSVYRQAMRSPTSLHENRVYSQKKILMTSAKGLLQQNRHQSDITRCPLFHRLLKR